MAGYFGLVWLLDGLVWWLDNLVWWLDGLVLFGGWMVWLGLEAG